MPFLTADCITNKTFTNTASKARNIRYTPAKGVEKYEYLALEMRYNFFTYSGLLLHALLALSYTQPADIQHCVVERISQATPVTFMRTGSK